jgi:hypothetical protein
MQERWVGSCLFFDFVLKGSSLFILAAALFFVDVGASLAVVPMERESRW